MEAVRARCKVPLPNSHGLPAALQAPTPHQSHNRYANTWQDSWLASATAQPGCGTSDKSAVTQRLVLLLMGLPGCIPKQGKLPVALDTATPQHTADNQGAASPVRLQPVAAGQGAASQFELQHVAASQGAASQVKLQPVAASQGAASPVKLQSVAASQVGNATRHLNANLAVTAVPSSASAGIAAKAGAAADATGQLPHQPAAAACCKNDIQHCEARSQSQQQGPCAARAASRLEPPAAPLTAANLFALHTAPAAPSSKQEDAKGGLNGTHRQHSSILYRHQHCLRERPAGSYSMQTSGSSRPPWDSSSQGTQSIKRSASIGQVVDAGGGILILHRLCSGQSSCCLI